MGLYIPEEEVEDAFLSLASCVAGAADATRKCSICLDGYEASVLIVTLPCSHHFHTACAEVWCMDHLKHRCPVCRATILGPETLHDLAMEQLGEPPGPRASSW